MSILKVLNDVSDSVGGKTDSKTIVSALNEIADALAGSDLEDEKTIEGAIRLLGDHIGGGGTGANVEITFFTSGANEFDGIYRMVDLENNVYESVDFETVQETVESGGDTVTLKGMKFSLPAGSIFVPNYDTASYSLSILSFQYAAGIDDWLRGNSVPLAPSENGILCVAPIPYENVAFLGYYNLTTLVQPF